MYTAKPYPGKFEGNDSRLVAEVAYRASMDSNESMGDVEAYGYYHSYVQGKRYDYIVTENSQGFVYVEYGDKVAMRKQWNALEKIYLDWYDETYPDGIGNE